MATTFLALIFLKTHAHTRPEKCLKTVVKKPKCTR